MGCECRDVGLARHCDVLGALDYAADGPDPGREFSGCGDIGLVLVDAALQHPLAPLHESSDALGCAHPVFATLKAAQEAGDAEKVKTYASLLYNQALLVEGMPLEDPVAFANAVALLMK